MRDILPNWIVVELADDDVVSCYYPACEPLTVDGSGLLTRTLTRLALETTRIGGQAFKGCIENKMRASSLEYQFLPMSTGYRFRPIRKSSGNESPPKKKKTSRKNSWLCPPKPCLVPVSVYGPDGVLYVSPDAPDSSIPSLQSLRSRHPYRTPFVVGLSVILKTRWRRVLLRLQHFRSDCWFVHGQGPGR